MPKPTHSASASPARKTARRRVRRQRSRARRLNQQRASGPSNRRPVKRRKLRDQASLDLGECLYECQERGYHMDSDVCLGRGVFSTGQWLTPSLAHFFSTHSSCREPIPTSRSGCERPGTLHRRTLTGPPALPAEPCSSHASCKLLLSSESRSRNAKSRA